MKIGIPGASLDTGNYGVNALAEASVKCLLERWPQAEFVFLASGRSKKTCEVCIGQQRYLISNLPIRFCRNIFLQNHYLVLLMMGFFLRVFRGRRMTSLAAHRNPYVKEILSLDRVADITGGDSFTDLYGVRRFIQGGLVKFLWVLYGKPLYYLPQTYGPFERSWVRKAAKYLLAKASAICCRDHSGYESVRGMFAGRPHIQNKVSYVPDVGFLLDACPVADALTESIEQCKREGFTAVGINISGLLYSGGYTRDNMFLLKADYQELAARMAIALLHQNCVLVFVPHVFPKSAVYHVESDLEACRKTALSVKDKCPEAKVYVADAHYTHGQIKYLIGLCDFFAGSRMHSCIAAMSQCVPAVGIAYSDKFRGVFESVGQGRYVIDAKMMTCDETVELVCAAFRNRQAQRVMLTERIPQVQKDIREQFRKLP